MIGGNIKLFISGAAALDANIEERYRLLGINIVQGYGLTETSPVVAVGTNSVGDHAACEVDDWEDIVAIAAGTGITLGLKSDGTVVATGYTRQRQCPLPGEWTEIKVPTGVKVEKSSHASE